MTADLEWSQLTDAELDLIQSESSHPAAIRGAEQEILRRQLEHCIGRLTHPRTPLTVARSVHDLAASGPHAVTVPLPESTAHLWSAATNALAWLVRALETVDGNPERIEMVLDLAEVCEAGPRAGVMQLVVTAMRRLMPRSP